MKYWEFLIQKEGDETWLPLEAQQVEILEGRYRVVAHTDRTNIPIEIRVSQLVTDEMPPRKRVRKRTSQISDNGLVVVMPFVHLTPGQWDLKCSSVNVIDDFMGDGWQYSVQLQVFEHSNEDWSEDWPVPDDGDAVNTTLVPAEGAPANADLPLVQAQAQLKGNQLKGNQQKEDQQQEDPPSEASAQTSAPFPTNQTALKKRPAIYGSSCSTQKPLKSSWKHTAR